MDSAYAMDLKELMASDEYFRIRQSSGGKSGRDSVRILELNDINSDGTRDTAYISYNENNSRYKIRFSCFKDPIVLDNIAELHLKDIEDLNEDGVHEIMLFLQSEESCWDEIRLYSHVGKWVEKYNGLTYQCTENNNYQFRKIDKHTVELSTYGLNRDSIDAELGDTLENIVPNALNRNLIKW